MNNKYIGLGYEHNPVMVKRGNYNNVNYVYLSCKNCTRMPHYMLVRVDRQDEPTDNQYYSGIVTCPHCGENISYVTLKRRYMKRIFTYRG